MAVCEYCGSVLEKNVTKCPSCGAPAPHNVSPEPEQTSVSAPSEEMTALVKMLLPLAHRLVDVLLILLSIFPGGRRRR